MFARNVIVIAVLAIFTLAQSTYAGEKKTITYVNKFGPVQERIILPVADREGHVIGAQMRQDRTSSSDAEWDGASFSLNGLFDWVNGSGRVWGYGVQTLKSGDKIFSKYSGNLQRSGEGEQWQTLGEGTTEIYGGTGKFANIKGSGTFKAEINPAGGTATNIIEIEY